MKRTISLNLELSLEQMQASDELQQVFSQACNIVADIAQESQEYNRVRLHHLVYRTLREKYPELGSQMACNAIAKVAHAYKALKHKKEIRFKETASVHFDKRTYSLKGSWLSLFTLKGRIKCQFQIGELQQKYLREGQPKEAELVRKGKSWFLNLVLELPDPQPISGHKVVGVDFGENNLAAMSNGKLINGGKLKSERDNFLGHRRRLQSNGSQSARQRLRLISGCEKRHVKYVNHCVAKEIVEEAIKHNCSTIVMEDLTNLRQRIKAGKRLRTRLHRWPFDQLRMFVEYKAQAKGIRILYVNPAYTSQTCSVCSFLGKRRKHRFECFNCGSLQHSDLNASRNILGLAQSADWSTGTVNCRHVATLQSGQ
jgi:putative transposase